MRLLRRLFNLGFAAALFFLICRFVTEFSAPGDRIYDFFFRRGFVQMITMAVFSLTATTLFFRFLDSLFWGRKMRIAAEKGPGWILRSGPFGRYLAETQRLLAEKGEREASSYADRIVRSMEREAGKAQEAMSFLTGSFPALGLLGTVLGLSGSLHSAFSGGALGADAVQKFVAALSTALDTTVLGIICALPAFGISWVLGRRERSLIAKFSEIFSRIYSAEKVSADGPGRAKAVSAGDPLSAATAAFRQEIQELIEKIAGEAARHYETAFKSSLESFQQSLKISMADAAGERKSWEDRMIETTSRVMSDRLQEAGQSLIRNIASQDRRLADEIVGGLKELEKALYHRIPEEVIIRYNGHNGDGESEDLSHVNA